MRAVAVLFNLLLVPGVGHVAIGRWRRGLPWLIAVLLTTPSAFLHPAAVLVLLVVPRIASAIEVSLLEQRSQPTPLQALAVYGGGLVAAAVWFSLMQTFVIEAWKIPSGSMIPTLEIGDHLFGSKLAYRLGQPARGDVAIFVNPCEPDKDFVMRVVGLPGDTIEVRCDVLYVNGVAAPATSLKEKCSYWDRKELGGPWVEESCTTYVEELAPGGAPRTGQAAQAGRRRAALRGAGGRRGLPRDRSPARVSGARQPRGGAAGRDARGVAAR